MPMPSHLNMEGKNQGKIEGSCNISGDGREGSILVQALEHNIDIPRDPQTGLPTGKRIHKPLVVTKEFDKSSPKLMQALCSGEQMKEVVLDFYRITETGNEEKYYTIKLENAIIVSIRNYFPNALDPSLDYYKHMQEVSFTYEKIIQTWVPDGIEAEDSWKAPKA